MIDPSFSVSIARAPNRRSVHWKQDSVTWGEVVGWMDSPADEKESGSYIFGELTETTVDHKGDRARKGCTALHRRKGAIASRTVLTLDVDHPEGGPDDFPESVELLLSSAAIIHTTFNSTQIEPRFRVLLPLDRPVAADEYHELAQAAMELLGRDQFDPGSSEPERYMFMPSEQQPGFFRSWVLDGPLLDTERMLRSFDPDLLSCRPTPKPHRNKRDPFEIEGVVGAFNRCYEDFNDLIAEYDLPYVEEGAERWRLRDARSEAGVVLVAPGLVYSHHVGDPAYDKTCSAFDLVRLHRFYELDEDLSEQTPVNRRPSHKEMLEVAIQDKRVKAELLGAAAEAFADDINEIGEEVMSSDWKLGLALSSRTGKMTDTIGNWDLLAENLEVFKLLRYNEFSMAVEVSGDLPWRAVERGGPAFTKIDQSRLCLEIEREFGVRPSRTYIEELVQTTAQQRFYNPVKDYLEGLTWDGEKRLEECLPGVVPTEYTRLVARKSLVAACARVFEPGVKWDHTLILYGTEGLGKTLWVSKMARGHSATLGRIHEKDTLITMQRSWIMVSDEGHSLKKAEHDAQKEFLTRTEDIFRMPYDREAQVHKRHCVIWGTTNDKVFLRRQEGNRRFLIVHCEERADFEKYTDEYVGQVWAEAMHLYRNGEPLFLRPEESVIASIEREAFTEEDAQLGIIEQYLETLVPDDWDETPIAARQEWLYDQSTGIGVAGTRQQNEVCSLQIWVEAFGKRLGDHRRTDLLEITEALKQVPGWRQVNSRRRLWPYGPQTTFVRIGSSEDEFSELI